MADPWVWGMLAWPIQLDILRSALLKDRYGVEHESNTTSSSNIYVDVDQQQQHYQHSQNCIQFSFSGVLQNGAQPGVLMANPVEPSVHERDLLINFFHALAVIYPCNTCRESYKKYLHQEPPETAMNLLVWFWELKNKVNNKLHRSGPELGLPIDKYEKRLLTVTSFSAVDQVWDLLCIFAINYPTTALSTVDTMTRTSSTIEKSAENRATTIVHSTEDTPQIMANRPSNDNDDPEDIRQQIYEKQKAYFQLIAAFHYFLGRLRTHCSLQQYLNPNDITKEDMHNRSTFVRWVVKQRQAWAKMTGGVAYSIDETYARYSPSPSISKPPSGYTCPNPALL